MSSTLGRCTVGAALVSALATAPVHAQIVLPPGFQWQTFASGAPFGDLNGIAVSNDGQVYVADDGKASLSRPPGVHAVDRTTYVVTTLLTGYPPSAQPGKLLVGDGRPLVGTDPILSDHNSWSSATCCNGSIVRIDRTTGAYSILAEANPVYPPPGDPYGIALAPGGAFGDGLFVVDINGASPYPPVLYRVDLVAGLPVATGFPLSNAGLWTTSREPFDLDFGGAAFGGDLFVLDSVSVTTIWRVTSAGDLSPFVTFPSEGLAAIRFGRGGLFGTNLFALGYDRIYMVTPGGMIYTFASGLPAGVVQDMAFSPDGQSLFLTSLDRVFEISAAAGMPVSIDVKPGSIENSINLGAQGTVPVAILGTADFDVRLVDPASITLAGAPVATLGNGRPSASYDDVNGDGRLDLAVHVDAGLLQLQTWSTQAWLAGQTLGGVAVWGVDGVRPVPAAH